MPRKRKDHIKTKILQEHGIVPVFDKSKPKLKKIPLSFSMPRTYAMKMVEIKLGKPIELIISTGSLDEVSEITGVERSTICRWRTKLGINFTETNLPSCTDCPHASYECVAPTMHICTLLRILGRKDLLPYKKEELDLLFNNVPAVAPLSHTTRLMMEKPTMEQNNES